MVEGPFKAALLVNGIGVGGITAALTGPEPAFS